MNSKLKNQNLKFAVLASALLLAPGFPAEAQPQTKIAKIGYLGFRSGSRQAPGNEQFRREFRALGYVEGKNVAFEYRDAEGNLDRLPTVADELVRLKVDVIVTASTVGVLAAKNATKTIPIVFYSVPDPVAAGLVDSLARPGGNITGFTIIAPVLSGKRLELLKETVPKLSRVAVLWNPRSPGSVQQWNESQLAARELALHLYSMEVNSVDKFEDSFKDANKDRAAALAVTLDILANANIKRVVELAAKYRLPAIYPRRDYVESGGLMSYGPDLTEPFQRAALYVDKILKGAKPPDLPIEQPTKFELMINLKTAKTFGLTIPPMVLMRAEKVIK